MARDKWVHIKVSDDEREQWRQLAEAHRVSVADLVRRSVGGFQLTHRTPPVRRKPPKRVDPELIRELGRIGNNVNQVARWANMYKQDAESEQVLAVLLAIERELSEVRKEHTPQPKPPQRDEVDDDVH